MLILIIVLVLVFGLGGGYYGYGRWGYSGGAGIGLGTVLGHCSCLLYAGAFPLKRIRFQTGHDSAEVDN
jgi:hypothetical protein